MFVAFSCLLLGYIALFFLWHKNYFYKDPLHPTFVTKVITLTLFLPLVFSMEIASFSPESKLAIFFSGFAILFFDLFLFKKRKDVGENDFSFKSRKRFIVFSIIFVFGWLGRMYLVSNGYLEGTHLATNIETHAASNLRTQIGYLSFYSIIGMLLFSEKPRSFLFAGLLLSEILWWYFTGTKLALFNVAVPVILVLFAKTDFKLNFFKTLFLGLVFVGLTGAAFGFIQAYRVEMAYLIVEGDVSPETTVIAVGDAAVATFEGQETSRLQEGALLERVNNGAFLGRLIESDASSKEIWYGSSLAPVFTWFVPRYFWPDKPPQSTGRWYATKILGWDENSKSEASITVWGDGYMNFGGLGILIFGFIWQFGFYYVYQNFYRRGGFYTFYSILLYPQFLFGVEQNLALLFIKAQFILILTIPFLILAKVKWTRNTPTA